MAAGKQTAPIAVPLRPIGETDQALVNGDRRLFAQFLEPFAQVLEGRPAQIVPALVEELFAFYVADTLSYLTRMLPASIKRPSRLFGSRQAIAEPAAPDTALMQRAPHEALAAWANANRQIGGALLMEARAITRHLTTGEVLKKHRLPLPDGALGALRYSENLPTSEYLHDLIDTLLPSTYYLNDQQVTDAETSLRHEFARCCVALGVRFLRVAQPEHAAWVEEVMARQGAEMADTTLRMQLPIDVYRKRRLEALAIFQDLVAPEVLNALR